MPDAPPTLPVTLSELLTALTAVLAAERRAVARLALDELEALAVQKSDLADALAAQRAAGAPPDRETARQLAVTRVALGANAALIIAARDAIQAALGIPPGDRYGRSARLATVPSTGTVRIVAG